MFGFTKIAIVFIAVSFAMNAQAAKTLVYCSEASPSSFNPQIVTDGTSYNASSKPVYNRLVEFKHGETTTTPGLAESWTVSKDNLKYTFKLRKGVKFHTTAYFKPTREFNADDVMFTFNRQWKKDHPFHKIGGGTYEYFDSMDMPKTIKDIKKIDNMTVEFTLAAPEAPFIANLAMDFASILSAEYAELLLKAKTPEKMDIYPVGTGPFVFKEYVKDSTIRYTAHPDYFRGKAKLDNLVFAITPDPSVRFQKLKTGECHFIAEPSPQDLPAMKKDSKFTVLNQAGLNVAYLAFNVKKKPFDNVILRKAFNHALNRKSYIDAIYMGNAIVAKNAIPPTMWSYMQSLNDYDYNPEKAKTLLKQAGFEKGLTVELWTMPVSRPYNPNGKKMGEMMQADLAKVGVTAKLITYDWPTYLEKSKQGEHQLLQMGWTGDNGDPDNFLNVLLGCAAVEGASNRAFWCDPKFDDIVRKAKSVTNTSERTKLYQEAQKVFKDQAPWVTLAHSTVHRAMLKNVSGYKIDPLGSDSFYEVDLK